MATLERLVLRPRTLVAAAVCIYWFGGVVAYVGWALMAVFVLVSLREF
jgi:hypothetical protein